MARYDLFETLFPEVFYSLNEDIATYMLHDTTIPRPVFFKALTDDILHVAVHAEDPCVYAISVNGKVTDVTSTWIKIIDRHRDSKKAVDDLLAEWSARVPTDVATYDLRYGSKSLGFFPTPSIEMLRAGTRATSILCIRKNGSVEDETEYWKPMFDAYARLKSTATTP